jgi:hypothetical protein
MRGQLVAHRSGQCYEVRAEQQAYKPGASSQTQPLHQFFVRDVLSMFGFGRQNSSCAFFIDFLFGSLREAAAELLIADGLPGIQKRQESVDLTRR